MTARIIGVSIEIHRALGSGLLEQAYLACLLHELDQLGYATEVQRPLPLVYKGIRLGCAYRADVIVSEQVLLEVKAVDVVTPVHMRQLTTCVHLAGCPVGLLLNFGAPTLAEGVHRVMNQFQEKEAV